MAKPFQEKVIPSDKLFVLKEERFKDRDYPFHIHPEYEIILVLNSSGKRFVGNNISGYNGSDLCLFGPNLPHNYSYNTLHPNKEVRQLIIQFSEDFLGKNFLEKPQFSALQKLLKRSRSGVSFDDPTKKIICNKIESMFEMDEFGKVVELLSILHILSRSKDFESLSGDVTMEPMDNTDLKRINSIYNYLLENFQHKVELEQVAFVANLTPPSFCRYFKKSTGKTFSEFLIQLRVGHACKLLIESNLNLTEISLQSGFNNISYFNRQFKKHTNKSPKGYRKQYLKN